MGGTIVLRHWTSVAAIFVGFLLVDTAKAVMQAPTGTGGQSAAVGAQPDTLIVRYRTQANARGRSSLHARMGATPVRSFDLIAADIVRVAPGADRDTVAAAYAAQPDVEYVQPNFIYHALAVPNDSRFSSQWSLRNTGNKGGVSGADIDAAPAWDLATGDRTVVVGVIDTGIDYTHPDLRDNMWTNEAERTGTAGVDDDGNGIVDDIYGAQFLNATGEPTGGDPFDDHFHGTHVGGTIGATGNNANGIAGVNHRVRLMAVKFINAFGFGYTADAIAAIEYSVAMGAQLTNNSWGGGEYDQALRDVIEAAGEAGQLFVASAGNRAENTDVTPAYPASYTAPNIIAVASTDRRDERSDFSNFGVLSVDIAAPGSDILSTVPGGYHVYSGTSMAAPHVTGVAALLFAHVPGARLEEVRQWILDGADHLPALNGVVGGGRRLNAYGALLSANPHAGAVSFDRSIFSCAGPLALRLRDVDLQNTGAVAVVVTSSSGDSETLQLLESNTAGVFHGTLGTRSDGVVAADALLAVLHGDIITATYQDADDGDGPAQNVATAALDCMPPQITNVEVTGVTGLGATVEFDTNEAAFGQVRYGTTCGQLTAVTRTPDNATAQVVALRGLSSETHYYFAVDAIDPAGTVTTDDNGGVCYELTTLFLQNYFTHLAFVTLRTPQPLEGQSTTFTPDGSPHFYSACREPAMAFPVDPTGGTPQFELGMHMSDSMEVPVQGGQQVSLYGQAYNLLHVNRNGSITFTAADPGPDVDPNSHFAQPRVSVIGYFSDPERGWVSTKQLSDRVVVTYQHLRDNGDRQESDAQAELFFDGRIRISIISVSGLRPPLVGLSAGGGMPDDFVETDLAAAPRCGSPGLPSVPLAGRKLKLTYDAFEPTASMRVDLRDPAFVLPIPGAASDPTVNGATMVLFNPQTEEHDFFYFPAVYWQASGTGYVYEHTPDRGTSALTGQYLVGPCYKVQLDGGRLRARCKRPLLERNGLTFSLDEQGGQQSLAVLFTLGAGQDVRSYCAAFGGVVARDRTWNWTKPAQFLASRAPAPSLCPTLP